jgi:flagellar biosynthetic protein FliQ
MGPSDIDFAVDIGREALWIAIKISFAPLLVGLVVGVVISIFQAATQVQEQTLTFIPKMFAVVVTLFVLMPWLLGVLVEYTQELVLTWMQQWR